MLSRQLDNRSQPGTVAPAPQVRRLGWFLVGASIILICIATLTPQPGHSETSLFCIVCGSLGGVDAVLNVILFLPLGIGLALSGARSNRALFAILCFSAAIEVAQFLVISGRDAAVGDVLNNVLGGAIGFGLARAFDVWWNPSRRAATLLSSFWVACWLAIQLLVSYGLTPAFPSTRYYGQIARVFENMATFGGRVLSATIDTVSIPDYGFAKTRQLHDLLEHGAVVRAVVIPAGPTSRVAPIIRVADDSQRQIVLLGQDRADVVFGVHTGAENLRLRPPLFRVRGVFPSEGGPAGLRFSDTLDLGGRYRPSGVDIQTASRHDAHSQHFEISSALGWVLILPKQWYLEDTPTELLLGFVWLATLLLPLGYWGYLAAGSPTGETQSRFVPAVGVLAIVLFAGLVLIPRPFGVAPASLGACLATAVGLAVGATLASKKRLPPTPLSNKPHEAGSL
jgi:hypothetical protein